MLRQLIAGASIAWAVLGCADQAPPVPHLMTDQTVYQLQPAADGSYKVTVTLTYTNRRQVPVYLMGVCGGSSPPRWSIGRADGSQEPVRFGGGYGCIGHSDGPFTEVLPGEMHRQTVVLYTHNPHQQPQYPMSVYTGTFFFEYQVVHEPKGEIRLWCQGIDCKLVMATPWPEPERVSNPFQVMAPS